MEAMATGLPVVATRVGGVEEVIADGETGFLTPPGSPGPLLDRVRSLVKDPFLRRRIGEAGGERIRAAFSVEAMVAGTTSLYEDLLINASSRAAQRGSEGRS